MATTIAAAPGSFPANASQPITSVPGAVAGLSWTASTPIRMDIAIQGLMIPGNFSAPAIAVIEHFDPYSNAIVRDFAYIGNRFGPTNLSIVTGSLNGELATGEVHVAVYNLGGTGLGVVGAQMAWYRT